jgi:hypothetical protein
MSYISTVLDLQICRSPAPAADHRSWTISCSTDHIILIIIIIIKIIIKIIAVAASTAAAAAAAADRGGGFASITRSLCSI